MIKAQDGGISQYDVELLAGKLEPNMGTDLDSALLLSKRAIDLAIMERQKSKKERNSLRSATETIFRLGKSTGLVEVSFDGTDNGIMLATCFILSTDGLALTAGHLFPERRMADELRIAVSFLPDAQQLAATLLLINRDLDIALIRISSGFGYIPLDIAFQDAIAGSSVTIIGHSHREQVFVEGHIIGQSLQAAGDIMLSAPAFPGFSGSPIMNGSGTVIGLALGTSSSVKSDCFGVSFRKALSFLLNAHMFQG